MAVGRIGRPYGIRGWVHVHSSMDPPEALLLHRPWLLAPVPGRRHDVPLWSEIAIQRVRRHGTAFVAWLGECADRNDAQALTGTLVGLPRSSLPVLEEDEYYWADLLGCRVCLQDGAELGTVKELFETGANDVMVVVGERERLVPFVLGETVIAVDLKRRDIVVDWDRSF